MYNRNEKSYRTSNDMDNSQFDIDKSRLVNIPTVTSKPNAPNKL